MFSFMSAEAWLTLGAVLIGLVYRLDLWWDRRNADRER